MPEMRMVATVTMIAMGSVLCESAAGAEPGGFGAVPETRGAASMVIQAHEPPMVGHQCIWFKGCKYCRTCVECQWLLQYCKKRQ